jgi:hypothetical protein
VGVNKMQILQGYELEKEGAVRDAEVEVVSDVP